MKKLLDGCFILGKDLKKRINLTPAEGPMLLNAWGPQTAESTTECCPLFVNTVVICKQAVKHVHAHLSVCFILISLLEVSLVFSIGGSYSYSPKAEFSPASWLAGWQGWTWGNDSKVFLK